MTPYHILWDKTRAQRPEFEKVSEAIPAFVPKDDKTRHRIILRLPLRDAAETVRNWNDGTIEPKGSSGNRTYVRCNNIMPYGRHGLIESVPTAVCGATLAIGAHDTRCLRFGSRCSKRVTWAPSRRRADRSLRSCGTQLYLLAAGLLEPVSLERTDAAEELVVRPAVLLGLVLDQG